MPQLSHNTVSSAPTAPVDRSRPVTRPSQLRNVSRIRTLRELLAVFQKAPIRRRLLLTRLSPERHGPCLAVQVLRSADKQFKRYFLVSTTEPHKRNVRSLWLMSISPNREPALFAATGQAGNVIGGAVGFWLRLRRRPQPAGLFSLVGWSFGGAMLSGAFMAPLGIASVRRDFNSLENPQHFASILQDVNAARFRDKTAVKEQMMRRSEDMWKDAGLVDSGIDAAADGMSGWGGEGRWQQDGGQTQYGKCLQPVAVAPIFLAARLAEGAPHSLTPFEDFTTERKTPVEASIRQQCQTTTPRARHRSPQSPRQPRQIRSPLSPRFRLGLATLQAAVSAQEAAQVDGLRFGARAPIVARPGIFF